MTELHKGVFSEDFSHFEQNHESFPVEAQSVFSRVSELRVALNAFRLATENKCVVDDVAVAEVLEDMNKEEPILASAVLETSSSPTNADE